MLVVRVTLGRGHGEMILQARAVGVWPRSRLGKAARRPSVGSAIAAAVLLAAMFTATALR